MSKKESMKKNQKPAVINKKIAAVSILIVVIIIVFRFVLLVPIIKLIISKSIESLAPVKVHIGPTNISINRGNLSLSEIVINDMRKNNILGVEHVQLEWNNKSLLRGQFYIPLISIHGLQLGMRSNVLKEDIAQPKEKKNKLRFMTRITDAVHSQFSEEALLERFNIKEVSAMKSSDTIRQINEINKQIDFLPKNIQRATDMASINIRISKVQKDWDELQHNTPSNIQDYLSWFQELKTINREINQINHKLQSRSQQANTYLQAVQQSIQALETRYQEDLQQIDDKITIINDIQGSVIERLLGEEVVQPLKQLTSLITRLRAIKKHKKIQRETFRNFRNQLLLAGGGCAR